MFRFSEVPYLSHIQHVEAVRTLPLSRRIAYSLLSAVGVVGAFVAMVALSIGLAFLLFPLIAGELLSLGDEFLLGASVVSTYFIMVGFAGNPVPRTIRPGDSLTGSMSRAFRSGLVIGLVTGFFFGMLWIFTVRISGIYVQLNTFYGTRVYLMDFIRYGIVIALSVAVPFAVFRALFSIIGHLALDLVRRDKKTIRA